MWFTIALEVFRAIILYFQWRFNPDKIHEDARKELDAALGANDLNRISGFIASRVRKLRDPNSLSKRDREDLLGARIPRIRPENQDSRADGQRDSTRIGFKGNSEP